MDKLAEQGFDHTAGLVCRVDMNIANALFIACRVFHDAGLKGPLHRRKTRITEGLGEAYQRRRRHLGAFREGGDGGDGHIGGVFQGKLRHLLQTLAQLAVLAVDLPANRFVVRRRSDAGHNAVCSITHSFIASAGESSVW